MHRLIVLLLVGAAAAITLISAGSLLGTIRHALGLDRRDDLSIDRHLSNHRRALLDARPYDDSELARLRASMPRISPPASRLIIDEREQSG